VYTSRARRVDAHPRPASTAASTSRAADPAPTQRIWGAGTDASIRRVPRKGPPPTYGKAELAWALVEHCRSRIPRVELSMAFVNLGAGEYDEAITVALNAAQRSQLTVPEDLHGHLTAWLKQNPLNALQDAAIPDAAAQDSTPDHRLTSHGEAPRDDQAPALRRADR
jgi:hypothetical protein